MPQERVHRPSAQHSYNLICTYLIVLSTGLWNPFTGQGNVSQIRGAAHNSQPHLLHTMVCCSLDLSTFHWSLSPAGPGAHSQRTLLGPCPAGETKTHADSFLLMLATAPSTTLTVGPWANMKERNLHAPGMYGPLLHFLILSYCGGP